MILRKGGCLRAGRWRAGRQHPPTHARGCGGRRRRGARRLHGCAAAPRAAVDRRGLACAGQTVGILVPALAPTQLWWPHMWPSSGSDCAARMRGSALAGPGPIRKRWGICGTWQVGVAAIALGAMRTGHAAGWCSARRMRWQQLGAALSSMWAMSSAVGSQSRQLLLRAAAWRTSSTPVGPRWVSLMAGVGSPGRALRQGGTFKLEVRERQRRQAAVWPSKSSAGHSPSVHTLRHALLEDPCTPPDQPAKACRRHGAGTREQLSSEAPALACDNARHEYW